MKINAAAFSERYDGLQVCGRERGDFSMRRWFLSYNSQEPGLIELLESALRRKEPDAKIFFAPKSLRAGGLWLPELAREIAEATVFVLLVGEKGIGPWQSMEYYEALDRRVKQNDFPIVLLLRDGQAAPGLPFLRQLHWVITNDPASEKSLAQVMDAATGGGAQPKELWRHTAPYRGLSAMTETDADFFSGRSREVTEIIGALAATPGKLPVLLGNSGVGKSSLAQAGVLAALMRQGWPETVETAGPWPQAFNQSRRWSFLKLKPGGEPVRALVEPFFSTWQFDSVDPKRAELLSLWTSKLLDGRVALRDLLDATEARYRDELHQPEPPAFLLYIDQAEELYVRSDERQRRRFSEILAQGLGDLRMRTLMTMRADFFGELQKDEALYTVHRLINVPPLREPLLRKVVSQPAKLLGAQFETDDLADSIAHLTSEESAKDAGALPLLSYLLDDMWTKMVQRGDGILRLPTQAIELGGVLVGRADAFLASHPGFEEQLRRIFILKLANVREGEEPTRRRAQRSEFTDTEWRLISELADHPNRLVVTASPEGGEAYAEVAHEAVFRRWNKLGDWIAAEREFLAWKTGLEATRRAWQAMDETAKNDALLMGAALTQAESWVAKRNEDLAISDRMFIHESSQRERRARGRARRVRLLVYLLLVGIIAGLIGWINQSYLKEQIDFVIKVRPYMLAEVRPYVLTAAAERALTPGDSFKECAANCPEMVVVPAGEFSMGSPPDEKGRYRTEGPLHKVVIGTPFAISKFEVTFAQWDACAAVGVCPQANDFDLGRGGNPVIFVGWDHVQRYVAWLSKVTGRSYRLLSEAEWEYAARAGTTTAYSWGNEIGKNNANCDGCGSDWDARRPAPVGSFASNNFGIYDMHGNVWEWVQDCYRPDYGAAPANGSARIFAGCTNRVIRGGSWINVPKLLRAAVRSNNAPDFRDYDLGFRVGRTLSVKGP